MLTENTLLSMIRAPESQSIERKTSKPKDSDLRRTLCAFANSTPEGEYSVLFLGVGPEGKIIGIAPETADKTQRDIVASGEKDYYPPIQLNSTSVTVEGKIVVAIVVGHSKNRPHFAGHAYVRNGATSRKATEQQYDEFVLDRIDKVRRILEDKGKLVSASWPNSKALASALAPPSINERDYRIVNCDAFSMQLEDLAAAITIAVPVEAITITQDMSKNRTQFIIRIKYPAPPDPSVEEVNRGYATLLHGLVAAKRASNLLSPGGFR